MDRNIGLSRTLTNIPLTYSEEYTLYPSPMMRRCNLQVLGAPVSVQFSVPTGLPPRADPWTLDETPLDPGVYSLDRTSNAVRVRGQSAGAIVRIQTVP